MNRFSRKYLFCFILIFLLIILYCGVTSSPLYVGETDDYVIPTISLLKHGSMEILESDIVQAEIDYPSFAEGIRNSWENRGEEGGFLQNAKGQVFTWYSGVYSAACIPVKMILDFFHLNQSYTFVISNVIFYTIALLAVYFLLQKDERTKFIIILLLCCSPTITGYYRWPSAEIFIFLMVVLSLVFFSNKQHYLSALFCALAGTQNSTVMFFGFVIIIDYFINVYKDIHQEFSTFSFIICIKNYWRKTLFLAICFLPCFLPFLLNYYFTGAFNLQVYYGMESSEGVLARVLAYLFDLNFGILPYFPLLLIAFLVGNVYALWKRNLQLIEFAVAFYGILFCFSFMYHINCGMTGISRYNAWLFPFIVLFDAIFFEEILKSGIVKMKYAVSYIIGSVIITISMSIMTINSNYVYFTPLASYVLEHAPAIYNPYPYTFVSRTNHIDGGYRTDLPSLYTDDQGYIHKVLVTTETKEYLRKSVRGNEIDTLIFIKMLEAVDDKRQFQYLNIPANLKLKIYDYKDYLLGTSVSFQNENTFFAKGISSCEGWGTWMTGNEAYAYIRFENYQTGDIWGNFEIAGIYNNSQQIRVRVGEEILYDKILLPENPSDINFVIPERLVENGEIILICEMPDAISPQQNNESSDNRLLSIALKRITFFQQENNGV